MSGCKLENWTIKELSVAMVNEHKDNKFISVPMFQRGKSWNKLQESNFIDSLKKGFPVGSLLFYRSVEGNKEIYTLTDGLQRCSTIKDFAQNPTKYFTESDYDDELIIAIASVLGVTGNESEIKKIVKSKIDEFVKDRLDINDIQYSEFTDFLAQTFPTAADKDKSTEITNIIKPFLRKYKEKFAEIIETSIPAIVYQGDIGNLPEIFDRVNKEGTKLSKYQVFAASWSTIGKVAVWNQKIVNHILGKYDKMIEDGYILNDYDKDDLLKTKQFNLFEYVFGFGKYICNEFPHLLEEDTKIDEINPIGFELLNACLGKKSDDMKNLHKHLNEVAIGKFEERVVEVIKFVDETLSKIIRFKGNNRGRGKTLHPKNQIISIISSTFREKYTTNNLDVAKKAWKESKKTLERNLVKHYAFDILSKEWSEGAQGKISAILRHNKYLTEISKESWETTLNSWFESYMIRSEKVQVTAVRETEKVFLYCIYAPIFSAEDQISKKFDIEHIATKDAMKNLLRIYDGRGLPISSIANLCLLPEYDNRAKKSKTFYQDEKYKAKVDISEVEAKYSFTQESDLSWIDSTYDENNFDDLKHFYTDFLRRRFELQKEKFYSSMQIQ